MTDFPDFYAVLEVPFGASASEIRRAYIRQACRWHPDKNPGRDTHERMLRINEAYVILHDPITRERYDREYLRRRQMKAAGTGASMAVQKRMNQSGKPLSSMWSCESCSARPGKRPQN